MFKKVFLCVAYILPIIFVAAVLFMYLVQPGYKTSMWLGGCHPGDPQGDGSADHDNQYLHSFLGNPYNNYALYTPNGGFDKDTVNQNDFNSWISDANFYGDVKNYQYCVNDTYDIYSGLADQGEMQIVLSTKGFELHNVTVTLDDEQELKAAGISVDYGFLRFIYASHNTEWGGVTNPFGVNTPMFVPDAISDEHTQPRMVPYHVYPVWVNIRTGHKVSSANVHVKFTITGLGPDNKTFHLGGQYANLHVRDIEFTNTPAASSLNFFQSPFWIQNFYDGGIIPKDVDNVYDINKYINYNKALWTNDFQDLHTNLKQDYFTMFLTQGKYMKDWHNLWGNVGVDVGNLEYNSFSPWTIDKDGNMTTDFSGFDNFANYMTGLGYHKMFMRGFKEGNYAQSASFTDYVFDERTNQQHTIDMSPLTVDGLKNNKIILAQLLKHVNAHYQDTNESWMQKGLQVYLYLDEQNEPVFQAYEDLIIDFNAHCLAGNGHFFKLAGSTAGFRAHLGDPIYRKIDIIYFYFSSLYNQHNTALQNLIRERQAAGLSTGQYSLISDHTFNLVRSEPGVSAYLILTLCKVGITDYMRYAYDEWNRYSYFSSDYNDAHSAIDVSGDVYFGYPTKPLGMGRPAPGERTVDPSVRMTMLAEGIRQWEKITYLLNHQIVNQTQYKDLMQYSNEIYENGRSSSSNKFNMNFKKIDLSKESSSVQKSYIIRYLLKTDYDKVDAIVTMNDILNDWIKNDKND